MEIDIEEIRNGKRIGDIVWICQYSRPDLDKRPLRNVPPTKVIVVGNVEITSGKKVYYSESHFSPFSKRGERTKKIIPLMDNTGYRGFPGNPLYVFTEFHECAEAWNAQIQYCAENLKEREEGAAEYWRSERQKLLSQAKVLVR